MEGRSLSRSRWTLFLCATIVLIGVSITFAQYRWVRTSFFDDTFIYLHVAQNAIEFGTWQYFPITDREAMVASSPLRAIVLTFATALAWPLTGGARSLESAALILPLSAVLSALVFLPFWWRDRVRYLMLAAPYALLCIAFESMSEFEGGLIYWWIATVVRDYVERRDTRASALAVVLGPLVRPDIGLLGIVALFIAYRSRGDRIGSQIRRLIPAAAVAALVWCATALAFGVWPIPTTYWTKASVPKLFDTSYMITFFFERTGQVALGSAPWGNRSVASALGVLWCALILILAARTRAFSGAGIAIIVVLIILYLARTPANFWWYYQNALIAFVALATCFWVCRVPHNGNGYGAALLITLFAVALTSKTWRDPMLPWNFAQPSRAQGYLAMAKSFAADGTIELPGLGRGYLLNPEIGITSYFGGANAFIGDAAGLAQAIPQSLTSKLRLFYPASLRTTYRTDVQRLAPSADVKLFEAWATETRDINAMKNCLHVVLERTVCVSAVKPFERGAK